ncbi:MAG: transposase [Clostridia bacterium]|nr:transposase [Clostridia bacterium]
MPRVARKKSPECSYHIMCRSISEIDLFQDNDDKKYYLSLLKRYSDKYKCSIFAFCLMINHVHLFINPKGFDISTFMHSLNSAYVVYFNRKYKRHGHLFQGRFASTIVDNNVYALTLSAYIHNNAKDIEGYAGREEDYAYSSYGIYTGKRKDAYGIINTTMVLELFSKDRKVAVNKYYNFVKSMKDTGIMKEVDESIWNAYVENEYRSEKKYIARDIKPETVVKKVCSILGENISAGLRAKYNNEMTDIRAFVTYIMRVLCGHTYKEICGFIGNMSLSGIVKLSNKGYNLIKAHKLYQDAFESILASA